MIFIPETPKPQQPIRPEGRLGVQISIVTDGVMKTLWLSQRKTTTADIFQTPRHERLGLAIGDMLLNLLPSGALADMEKDPSAKELLEMIGAVQVDCLELKRDTTSSKDSSDFSFGLEIALEYGDSPEDPLRVWLALEKKEKTYTPRLVLRLGNPDSPVEVALTINQTGFSAHFQQSFANPESFTLGPLGRILSPELEALMGAVEIAPLEFTVIAHKKTGSYVLGLALEGGITLSRLPFVGDRLPEGEDVGIDHFKLVWCSPKLAGDEQTRADILDLYKTRKRTSSQPDLIDDQALRTGGEFRAQLTIASTGDGQPIPLRLPVQTPRAKSLPPARPQNQSDVPTAPKTAAGTSIAPKPQGSAKWIKVGKRVGPLNLQQLGFKYENKEVWFLFDASVTAGVVELIVDGLGAGFNPFEIISGRFEPSFTLRGLGLSIKGPAEIGGAFLRDRITDPRGDYDEFSGVVLLKTEALTLSGMGSYAEPSWSGPSFFAYLFLDKPIGGPPVFFVTGLAIGIAINRNLDLPPIDQVAQFPLVRLALGQPPTPPDSFLPVPRVNTDSELTELLKIQQAMRPYTRPNPGRVAFGIGIRFTTFQLLHTFALFVVSLGKPFKLDLLVSSRMQIPPLPPGVDQSPIPPIAQIGIDLRGTWIPEQGIIVIEGRITEGSWFLDGACRLSGGAAFATWTSGPHAGDFVISIGGYHSRFNVPAHYPKVPRLALTFTRPPIEIKGSAYFALTPSALMAGGQFSALYNGGDLKAWFNFGADFLVAWEPFNYQADIYIELDVSGKFLIFPINLSVAAQIKLWGPDLGGIATVDIGVAEIDIEFGAPKPPPKPVKAQVFRERFLPADDGELISIGVNRGLIRTGTYLEGGQERPLFVVNPADFTLAIESVIPKPDGKNIGVGPMGVTALKEGQVLTIKIKKINDKEITQGNDDFKHEPISKPVPAALWGPAPEEGLVRSPGLQSDNPVIDAVVGSTLRPQAVPQANGVVAAPINTLLFNEDTWKSDLRENPTWIADAERLKPESALTTDILTLMSDRFPTQLVSDLTESGRELDLDLSSNAAWLADLQELPRIVTLESST